MSDQVPPTGTILQEQDGPVVTLTLDRPHRRNALTVEAVQELTARFREVSADPQCRVIVLTGAQDAFCSGADLRAGSEPDLALLERAKELVGVITTCPQPVIARVPGLCVGIGVPIALAADLVVAAESAYFLLSFVNIALTPDGGATALVPANIGRARAMAMALVPERLPARTAQEWGMIHQAVPDADLDEVVGQLAQRLAAGPAQALAATKRTVNAATLGQLDDAIDREAGEQARLIGSPEFAAALAAFAARRHSR